MFEIILSFMAWLLLDYIRLFVLMIIIEKLFSLFLYCLIIYVFLFNSLSKANSPFSLHE